MDLTSYGMTNVTLANACKERSCATFTAGAYFTLPGHNFSIYPALSYSLWFQPSQDSDSESNTKIFDFGNGAPTDNIFMGRSGVTDQLQLGIYRGTTLKDLKIPGKWRPDTWTHVVWTLARQTDTIAVWTVYVDAEMVGSYPTGYWPAPVSLGQNKIGKSNVAADGKFICVCVCVCVYIYIYIYIYI